MYSIQHTGTFFLYDHVFHNWAPARNVPNLGSGEKYRLHIDEPGRFPIGEFITIVPLRNYDAVRESWRRRGLNTDILDRQWAMILTANAFFLHIDAAERDEQLKRLSVLIGYELSTDWAVINSIGII